MMISKTPSRPSAARGLDGFGIVGFEHDLDVELAERIVEIAHGLRELRQHRRFAEHRHQHGEDRQILGAQRARFDRDGLVDVGGTAAADRNQNALEDEIAEIKDADRDVEQNERIERREGQSRQDRAQQPISDDHLRRREDRARRHLRIELGQFEHGAPRQGHRRRRSAPRTTMSNFETTTNSMSAPQRPRANSTVSGPGSAVAMNSRPSPRRHGMVRRLA